MSNMAIVENIVLYVIVALLFWFTRSPWSFLFLMFVNFNRGLTKRAADVKPAGAFQVLSVMWLYAANANR